MVCSRAFGFCCLPFSGRGRNAGSLCNHNCGALAGDRTRLAQTRALLAEHGKPARLLAETISSDPLAAAVGDDDPAWTAIVNWVMEALVQAEESGVTQANVRTLAAGAARDADPLRRFLLGGSRQVGGALGLDNSWVEAVIEATGNYGEIYERDLGSASRLKLPRGENNLHERGGLMRALPLR